MGNNVVYVVTDLHTGKRLLFKSLIAAKAFVREYLDEDNVTIALTPTGKEN